MGSVALYRTLIPDHAEVDNPSITDPVVSTWLGIAARRHPAAPWGVMWPEAMVWWAAHNIEGTPGMVVGGAGAGEVGPLLMQRDDQLQRQYGAAQSGHPFATAAENDLRTTKYGLKYLDIRDTRAGSAPNVIQASTVTNGVS